MDEIKIQNYTREHPEGNFPSIEVLSQLEIFSIRRTLCDRYLKTQNVTNVELVQRLDALAVRCESMDATHQDFSIVNLLSDNRLSFKRFIYINWHQYDRIDQMQIRQLDEFFQYIWYPGSDDMDLFDDSFNWIVSIHHNGSVKLLKSAACHT